MEVFTVGGAVRDLMMGRTPADYDYVVVGSTPEQMLSLDYRLVGADFPVFLHPETGAEYALARTERKAGPAAKGFVVHSSPDVTLEQDLGRRDLTINAMAIEVGADKVVDPYGGQRDIRNKVLRHVSADSFAEDPVRVLRLGRFAARYTDFTVAPETLALCQEMVAAGALDNLVAERVWQELAKGLMETQPSRMFEVLRACGALRVVLPEVDALWGVPQTATHHPEVDTAVHTLMVVDQAAAAGGSIEVRFAALVHDLGKALTPAAGWPAHHGHEELGVKPVKALCARLRVPSNCREVAVLVCAQHLLVHKAFDLRSASVVKLLARADAFRRPERLEALLAACEADARGRLGFENRPYPQAGYLRSVLAATAAVDTGAVAKTCAQPVQIPLAIHAARVRAAKSVARTIQSPGACA